MVFWILFLLVLERIGRQMASWGAGEAFLRLFWKYMSKARPVWMDKLNSSLWSLHKVRT